MKALKKDYTPQQYNEYVSAMAPKSRLWRDCAAAFVVGGAICVIAQLIGDFLKLRHVSDQTVAIAVPVIMVGLGASLTGLNVYSKIGKFAGAGSIVPITGFANAVVSPAMEFKTEGLVLGLAAKMFVIAGPVIVYGAITSVVVGLCHFLFG